MSENHWFYCGKRTSNGIIYHGQKGVQRVCFEVCERRCKQGLTPDECDIYMEELEAVTAPA